MSQHSQVSKTSSKTPVQRTWNRMEPRPFPTQPAENVQLETDPAALADMGSYTGLSFYGAPPPIQRQEEEAEDTAEETIQAKCSECEAESTEPTVQRREEDLEDAIQPMAEESEAVSEDETPLQAKLSVGKPGDKYEQEADSMAARVMAMSDPSVPQEEMDGETVQAKSLAGEVTPLVQRRQIQRKGNKDASPNIERQLSDSGGGGRPLGDGTRSFMESRFGADFSGVRVHTDSAAVQMTKSLGAQAFTHGQDIYYGKGKSPGKNDLTAHELTHTIQQTGGEVKAKSVDSLENSHKELEVTPEATSPQPDRATKNSLMLWRMVQTKMNLHLSEEEEAEKEVESVEEPKLQMAATTPPPDDSSQGGDIPGIQAKYAECATEENIQKPTITSMPMGEVPIQAFGLSDIGEGLGDAWDSGKEWVGDRIEDAQELGEDAFDRIVAEFSPQLAELIRNGPQGVLTEEIERGVQGWLQGVLGNVDLGNAISHFQSNLSETFALIQGVAEGDEAACAAFAEKLNAISQFVRGLMENPAIQALQEAFNSVSGAFQQVTDLVVAPVFDTLMEVAGDVFSSVTNLAKTIWDWGAPVRNFLSDAWNWVLEQLGIGGDGEGGILGWLQEEASNIWSGIQETFGPIIAPVQKVLTTMLAFSPVGLTAAVVSYAPQIIESVQWLWNNKDNPDIIRSAHEEMGHTILPQLLSAGQSFSEALQTTVSSFIAQTIEISEGILELLGGISGVPLLSVAQNLVQTVSDGIQNLVTWCQETFQAVSGSVVKLVGRAREKLAPYAEVLSSLGLALINPAMIPVILAGQAWIALPPCYKEPIIDFLLDTLIGLLSAAPDLPMFGLLWPMIKSGVLGLLEGVKSQDTENKVAISNKLAKIISGGSPAFIFGFVKGLLKGIWEGLTDPFILMYEGIKALGNLTSWLNETANSAMGIQSETDSDRASETGEEATCEVVNKAEVGQRMLGMKTELEPPVGQVTENFMSAAQEAFSGGEGLTFESLMQKLGEVWTQVQSAISNAGNQLAQKVKDFLLQDSAEGQMGESVGWLAGTIAFEVVLGILSAGSVTAAKGVMKVATIFAKVLDWSSEAMGLAFNGLAKFGGHILDILKNIGKFLKNAGGTAQIVLEALEEIGEKLIKYADELIALVNKQPVGKLALDTGRDTAQDVAIDVLIRDEELSWEMVRDTGLSNLAFNSLSNRFNFPGESNTRKADIDSQTGGGELNTSDLSNKVPILNSDGRVTYDTPLTTQLPDSRSRPVNSTSNIDSQTGGGDLKTYEISNKVPILNSNGEVTYDTPLPTKIPDSRSRPVNNSSNLDSQASGSQLDNYRSNVDESTVKIDKTSNERSTHIDEPEVEPGIVAKEQAADGHEIKVLTDGRIVRCSDCGEIRAKYADELNNNPDFRQRLDEIEKIADPQEKARQAKQIQQELAVIRNKGWGKGQIPCFPVGTLVSTPNGTTYIEKLGAGDVVYAYDFHSASVVIRQVLALYHGSTSCWVDIYFDSDVLRTTQQHPIWVESEQTWVEAAKLAPGMRVRLQDEQILAVSHIEVLAQRTTQETYNLTVEAVNNFFAGKLQVLVHNTNNRHNQPGHSNYVLKDANDNIYYVGRFGPNQTQSTVEARHSKNYDRYNSVNKDKIEVLPGTRTYAEARRLEHELCVKNDTYIGRDPNTYRGNRNYPMAENKLKEYYAPGDC